MSGKILAFGFALLLAAFRSQAPAFECRPELIPNGRKIDGRGCINCHVDADPPWGGSPRNLFGQEIEKSARFCEPFWSPALAAADSDGDGIPNGVELEDPLGAWKLGEPDPGNPERVTNPGVPGEPLLAAEFRRGDADADGAVALRDATFILEFIFQGKGILFCRSAADANADGDLDISDAIFILEHLFLGRAPPPSPGPHSCGPAAPGPSCRSYRSC
ncbi:MAG: hypothetical protein HY717_17620 [Planctomycetes bacterium]|nr:hypothetical protein [Planctomycetota bacterium]